MKLPNGITGLFEDDVLPETDWKLFKQLCYEFAIHNGGKILDLKEF